MCLSYKFKVFHIIFAFYVRYLKRVNEAVNEAKELAQGFCNLLQLSYKFSLNLIYFTV